MIFTYFSIRFFYFSRKFFYRFFFCFINAGFLLSITTAWFFDCGSFWLGLLTKSRPWRRWWRRLLIRWLRAAESRRLWICLNGLFIAWLLLLSKLSWRWSHKSQHNNDRKQTKQTRFHFKFFWFLVQAEWKLKLIWWSECFHRSLYSKYLIKKLSNRSPTYR